MNDLALSLKQAREIEPIFLLTMFYLIPFQNVKDEVYCERRTDYIIKSMDTMKTCHDFVATCLKIFDCLERLKPCTSVPFGTETSQGFELENVKKFISSFDMPPCEHWAVKITVSWQTGKLLCAAKRFFKVKSMGFCESFEWACQNLLDCLHNREFCHYAPNKATNFSVREELRAGIMNFQMEGIPRDGNPTDLVPKLHTCNQNHGYAHLVHLYFITIDCPQKEVCEPNLFEEDDEEKFQYKVVKRYFMFGSGNPLTVMQAQNRMIIWACKREAFSTVTCPEFLRVCDEIKSCMLDNAMNLSGNNTPEMVHEDTCYSPLPVSTINPNPEEEVGGHGYFPGILGPSLTYTLPLEKTYPRVFHRMQHTGYEDSISEELKAKRTNLFFDLFMEDCRYKHRFEGFLIEPFYADEIDYLICSVPFGVSGFGENPLVTKGCSHIKRACDSMKQCYIHHAEYFGFHDFFNENVLAIAITITLVSALILVAATMDLCVHTMLAIGIEHVISYFLYICLGVTGSAMIAFHLENTRIIEANGTSFTNESLGSLPILRLIWHLSSFFLTASFHLFTVCYTTRWERNNFTSNTFSAQILMR